MTSTATHIRTEIWEDDLRQLTIDLSNDDQKPGDGGTIVATLVVASA